MLRLDLVKEISLAAGIIQEDVEKILIHTIDIIRTRVTAGHEVHLREFGVFKTRQRPAKIARNLKGRINGKRKNPEPLLLPAKTVAHFKLSKKFLKA